MARIKDSSVEAVKAALDIVSLVEGYTRLRKSGGRFVGLCPFHQEKTPSFGVSPDRGIFKCFGCGEGGDAIWLAGRGWTVTGTDFSAVALERCAAQAERTRGWSARPNGSDLSVDAEMRAAARIGVMVSA